ncbi:MAG: sigma-70 family RNA polymerase sigma factor [Pyrinomonadaceae bacterium]|nr:sigma-70 family RNA polymerase sigma factor [Pyrinomonadaceae bacterium]MDQ3135571.1 sigma-70 family RNA polymerase sigma factor [Acidobacteriota bacterium]
MKEDILPATAVKHLRPAPAAPPSELEQLFREHHEQIFRTAHHITGSQSDAEDVLQTIFLRLARNDEAVDFSPSPASYFYRAAINASLDLLRSRSRARSIALEDVDAALLTSPLLSPETQYADQELRLLVRQAVARLGTRAAEVFVLRYFEGYDNREIAGVLNTSQMVVAVTLHRARLRLRKEIGQYLEKHHETSF